MTRRAFWPPTPPAGGPSTDECAPGDVHRHRAHDRAQAAPARAAAADPAADGIVAQAAPAALTGAPVAPGGPLPVRSGAVLPAGSSLHQQVHHLERIAALHAELADAYRALARDVGNQLEDVRKVRLMEGVNHTPRLLTADDLAERLRVRPRTVRRMRARGQLPPAIDLHSVVRWDEATVEAWLEGRRER